MRSAKIIIVIVLLAGLFLILKPASRTTTSASHTDSSSHSEITQNKSSPAVDQPIAAAAAAKPEPAVTVVINPAIGRESLRIAGDSSTVHSQQKHEDMLTRFRFPNSRPITGAENFELLKLKAIPTRSFAPGMGEKIEDKFGFTIFAAPGPDFNLTTDGSLPVVAKKGSGMLGIVTGTILVTLKDSNLAQGLAQAHSLKLKFVDPDLKLAYFSAPTSAPLDQIVSTLSASEGVEHVTLEVVQARKRL